MIVTEQAMVQFGEAAGRMCAKLFAHIEADFSDRDWPDRVASARVILHESAEAAIQGAEALNDAGRALARVVAIRTIEERLLAWYNDAIPGARDAEIARLRIN